MTKEEAARELLAEVIVNLEILRSPDHAEADYLDILSRRAHAFALGAKALLREGIHKRRNHASRVHRGLPPFCQGSANPGADCQASANGEGGAE